MSERITEQQKSALDGYGQLLDMSPKKMLKDSKVDKVDGLSCQEAAALIIKLCDMYSRT